MRKSFKKAAAIVLTAAMALSMTACGGGKAAEETKAEAGSEAAEPAADGETKAAENAGNGEKLKMTLCIGRKNDLSFQQSAYEGAMRVQEEMGDKFEVNVVEMGDDTTKWQAAFYDAADSGADIIVGTGFQNKENFETIPLEYPDTKFILFDQDVDYSSGDLGNVLTVLFDSNQSGFLAGAVAAYYTTGENAANTDKTIGFVGGTESTTKDLANAQISEGADIVFQVAGGAGNGVIEAAAEKDGVMAIGVDSDQYRTLEGSNLQASVITSSLKLLDNALFKICSDYVEDPSKVPFGTTVTYGLKDNAVGIVFNENLTKSIGEENVAKVKEILGKIQSGEITVSDAAELTADQIKEIVNN